MNKLALVGLLLLIVGLLFVLPAVGALDLKMDFGLEKNTRLMAGGLFAVVGVLLLVVGFKK